MDITVPLTLETKQQASACIKHIDLKIQNVRKLVKSNVITVQHIFSKQQPPDILTKPRTLIGINMFSTLSHLDDLCATYSRPTNKRTYHSSIEYWLVENIPVKQLKHSEVRMQRNI